METHEDSHPASPDTTPEYTLPVEDVAAQFNAAGFPFSPRSASRWCKNGRLDCILVPIENGRIDKYFATQESVKNEIGRMSRFKNPDMAGHGESRQDTASHGKPHHDTEESRKEEADDERVKGLEAENLHLKIDNKAKEQVIGRMVEERKEFVVQLTEQSRTIGQLETKLLALGSGQKRDGAKEPDQESDGYVEQVKSAQNVDNQTKLEERR